MSPATTHNGLESRYRYSSREAFGQLYLESRVVSGAAPSFRPSLKRFKWLPLAPSALRWAMAAIVAFLNLLDEKRVEAEQECDELASQCHEWLAETRQKTEKQLLYRS